MNLFDNDTVSSNESVFVNLLEGKHDYKITSAAPAFEPAQPNQPPVCKGITVNFQHLESGKRHTHFYKIGDPGVGGKIAKADMKALFDACGLSGPAGLDRLPQFADKTVTINAEASGPEKKFTNIRGTWPYAGPSRPAVPTAVPPRPLADEDLPMDHGVSTPPVQSQGPSDAVLEPAGTAPATTERRSPFRKP